MARKMSSRDRARQKLRRIATLECENWNLKHPVGTAVVLAKDSGEAKETKTRSEAYVAASGHAVCFFEDVVGYYLLNRAQAMRGRPPSGRGGAKNGRHAMAEM